MKNNNGFTLTELLLVMGIAVVIGILMLSILSNNTGFFYRETGLLNEGISQNHLSDGISEYVSQATQVASGYPVISPIYTSGSSVLVLQIPGLSVTGTILSNVYDYVVVNKDSSNPKILRLQIFPDPSSKRGRLNEVITTLLNSITFSYFDLNNNVVAPTAAAQVQATISLLTKTGSVSTSGNIVFKTTLRNH